ncbi:MAG TPA: SDR family oxidoreductase [Hymenobacter sp.]|jgi:NAD(P)H dehydrogenase (quinone)
MRIAITGATGQLGRLVIEKLKARVPADQLVAVVRDPAKAADLGVEARQADYTEPDTLETALQGMDTLLLVSSSEVGQRTPQHRNVIEAAQKAGVKRIAYTSVLHADSSPLSLAIEHRETEALLKESGLPYTILRNGWYTENYLGSVPGALASGALMGSAQNGKISSATREDFAEAAVAVLTGEGHEGKTYELAGDEAYTLSDLAAKVSRQTGKSIAYTDLPVNEYAGILAGFGIPEGFAQALAGFDADAGQGALYDESRQLSALIGRPTTPLATVVAAVIK